LDIFLIKKKFFSDEKQQL